MSLAIQVVGPQGAKDFSDADLPLIIGTAVEAQVRIPGALGAAQVATISVLDGRPFLQPVGQYSGLELNSEALAGASWLSDGDVIGVEAVGIECHFAADQWNLALNFAEADYQTLPPDSVAEDTADAVSIAPIARRNSSSVTESITPGVAAVPWQKLLGAALLVLLLVVVFLFTARAVRIEVNAPDAAIHIAGAMVKPKFGGRYLLWPGDYQVTAEADGYRANRFPLPVSREASQTFSFELEKLPGMLVVKTRQDAVGQVSIDGVDRGSLPTEPIELPAGLHRIEIASERYLPFASEIDFPGLGREEEFIADLQPAWADVKIETLPAGAAVSLDGDELGVTPSNIEVMAGSHEVLLQLDGYKLARQAVTVAAGEQITLPLIELQAADGLLAVSSQPSGAAVSIDGRYRGTTPVDVELAPGSSYQLIVSKPGYETLRRKVTMETRQGKSLRVKLEARVGELTIRPQPSTAEVFIDGQRVGVGEQSLTLPARPTRVMVRSPGFVDFKDEVTPKPGSPQILDAKLLTQAEAVLAATPTRIKTSQGAVLQLVAPGSFAMGTPRRQQGRRPNESQRKVSLSRSFYMGVREVTNTEFRAFRSQHTSGGEKYRELAIGDHPVALLSWNDAVAFCNWLSDQESLPPAYKTQDGQFRLVLPTTIGYRLPTEAEWAWVARYSAGAETRRYPWGDKLPPTQNAGNFADRSAVGIVANVLANYGDGYPVSAPVGKFRPSPLGFYDLGGNAAEWLHDWYTVYSGATGDGVDPRGPDTGQYHVIRGSSWRHASISELRLAYRDFGNQGRLDVGFRLARYAKPGAEQN